MLVMLGEKGLTGAVKMSGIVINFIFKVIVNVLKAAASCLGSYFFIVIAALALIFVVYAAGEVQYVHNVTAYTYSEDSDTTGMVEGSVKVPRLAGTDTELTYKEVTHNKWYSAHVAEGGTPFPEILDLTGIEVTGAATVPHTPGADAASWKVRGRSLELPEMLISGTQGSLQREYISVDRRLKWGLYAYGTMAPGQMVMWLLSSRSIRMDQ